MHLRRILGLLKAGLTIGLREGLGSKIMEMPGPRLQDERDLAALVGQLETTTLEFKKKLPEGGNDSRAEFAKDVAGMSNAEGGVILYGVGEKKGVATEIYGVAEDPDDATRRLRSIMDAQIKPRIPGARIDVIGRGGAQPVIVVRLPRSWTGPHMVREEGRFWIRRDRQVERMDVDEVRRAFSERDSIRQGVSNFRDSTLDQAVDRGIPLQLRRETGVMMLHVVPWSSTSGVAGLDFSQVEDRATDLPTPLGRIDGSRFNLDGLLTFVRPQQSDSAAFAQLYRTGAIASGMDGLVALTKGQRCLLHDLVKEAFSKIPTYVSTLRRLGMEPPITIGAVLRGVHDVRAVVPAYYAHNSQAIDRDLLYLPDVTIESDENVMAGIELIWEALWQAMGWPRPPVPLSER